VLSSDTSNFGYAAASYGVAFQVFFSVTNFVLCAAAAFWIVAQVRQAKRANAPVPDLAILTLSLEFVGCLTRFVYVVVDPLWAYGTYPSYLHLFFGPGFNAFSLSATVVIAVFWSSVVCAAGKSFALRNWKSVIIVVALILVVFFAQIILGIMRVTLSVSSTNYMLLVSSILSASFIGACALYFLITGALLIHRLRKGRQLRDPNQSQVVFFLVFVIVDTVLLVGEAIVSLLFASDFFGTVVGFYTVFSLIWLLQLLVSANQIFVFAVRGYWKQGIWRKDFPCFGGGKGGIYDSTMVDSVKTTSSATASNVRLAASDTALTTTTDL
jgi:hypothetical protein